MTYGSVNARPSDSSAKIRWQIAVLVVAVLSVVVFFIALSIQGKRHMVVLDPKTMCPDCEHVSSVTAILLDMSDEISEAQGLQIRNELSRQKNLIPKYGLLDLYTVTGRSDSLVHRVLRICNPGTGEGVSPVYQNPQMAEERWEHFEQKLSTELDKLLVSPSSESSAILESIQAVALRTLGDPQWDGKPKTLIVVSDLLQNVPQYSQYEVIEPFSSFRKSAYYNKVRADLIDVKVIILYMTRPGTNQVWPKHYLFWEEYLSEQGASVEDIVPIHGAE